MEDLDLDLDLDGARVVSGLAELLETSSLDDKSTYNTKSGRLYKTRLRKVNRIAGFDKTRLGKVNRIAGFEVRDNDSVAVKQHDPTDSFGTSSLDDKSIYPTIKLDPSVWQFIHVRCEPVIEILYAKVYTDNNASLDVYGDIRILDGSTKDFIVYVRDRIDSPQHISATNNFLQLSSPAEIPTFNDPHLVVDIKNAHTGAVIAHGQKPLSKTTLQSNDFENLYTLQYQGDACAFVQLQCVAFTFGVYAKVEIVVYRDNDASHSLYSIEDEEEDGKGVQVEVFGLICAKSDPLILPKNSYTNHLFNVIQEESEWVTLGSKINLSKSFVAVPAYSLLNISLDLSGYDGVIVQGSASFVPTNFDGGAEYIRGLNGFYAWVHVEWCEPSLLNEPCCEENMIDGFCSMPHSPSLYASQLLEVFSLFISRPNKQEVNLYGSVKILDSRGWCSIFNCSKDDTYCLSRGSNFLPLQGPNRACTPGGSFFIKIDLRDVDGHVNIKGSVTSCPEINERQRPWFDRRLCSIVRSANEKSFAAVNYTLFSFAVLAVIEVCLIYHGRSFTHVKIYGDITTFDGKLLYSANYDVEFFRRVLCTGKKEHLKLSANHVAVPMGSSLLMKVNLSFQTSTHAHHLEELVKFQIGEHWKDFQKSKMALSLAFPAPSCSPPEEYLSKIRPQFSEGQ